MTDRAYRISWVTFALAVSSFVLVHVVLVITDDGRGTWDQLPRQLNILFGGYLIAFVFLTVSFVAGLYAWRRRKIALLWVVPGGLVVMPTAAYFMALLAMYLVAPFWNADWL